MALCQIKTVSLLFVTGFHQMPFFPISSSLKLTCAKSFLFYVVENVWCLFALLSVLWQAARTAHWHRIPCSKSIFWSTRCMCLPSSEADKPLTCVNNRDSNEILRFQQQLAWSICSRSHYWCYIHQNKQLFVLIHMLLDSHTKEFPFQTRWTGFLVTAWVRSTAGMMTWDGQQQQPQPDPVFTALSQHQGTSGW